MIIVEQMSQPICRTQRYANFLVKNFQYITWYVNSISRLNCSQTLIIHEHEVNKLNVFLGVRSNLVSNSRFHHHLLNLVFYICTFEMLECRYTHLAVVRQTFIGGYKSFLQLTSFRSAKFPSLKSKHNLVPFNENYSVLLWTLPQVLDD